MGLPQKSDQKVGRHKGQPVDSDFFGGPEDEDKNIVRITKRSAWILFAVTLVISIDFTLPDKVIEEEAIEFVYAGNVLEKVKTESATFTPANSHGHSISFSEGPIRINVRPITGFVSSYQLPQHQYTREYRPQFCQDSWISLIYITLALSIAQLIIPIPVFYRMAFWIFSLGSTFGYAVMVFAFS